MITERTGMVHVSTGDLFRAALRDGTPLGQQARSYMDKGELVPDSVVIGMVKERISQPDCQEGGVLFDGFPRTADQAAALDEVLAEKSDSIDAVLNFHVPDEVLVKRLSGRRISKSSGTVYNIYFNPPKVEGVDDKTGNADLYQRDDDKEETVARRLEVYREQTAPLIDYYRSKGLLHEIDGNQEMDTVKQAIMQALGQQT
jgi:adenylate kinase